MQSRVTEELMTHTRMFWQLRVFVRDLLVWCWYATATHSFRNHEHGRAMKRAQEQYPL